MNQVRQGELDAMAPLFERYQGPLLNFFFRLTGDREASRDLEQVLTLGDEDLRVPAEWYLALAHLHGPVLDEARPHLERIAGTGGFYRDKARALLADLDRIEKRD